MRLSSALCLSSLTSKFIQKEKKRKMKLDQQRQYYRFEILLYGMKLYPKAIITCAI